MKSAETDEFQEIPVAVIGQGIVGQIASLHFGESEQHSLVPNPPLSSQSVQCASLHAQCILHRGYSYTRYVGKTPGRKSEGIIVDFVKAAACWDKHIESRKLPHSRGVIRCFTKSSYKRWAAKLHQFNHTGAGVGQAKRPAEQCLPAPMEISAGDTPIKRLPGANPERINKHWAEAVTMVACDEVVVRPSVVMDDFQRLVANLESRGIENETAAQIKATGFHSFNKIRQIPHNTIFVLLVKSRSLPLTNLIVRNARLSVDPTDVRVQTGTLNDPDETNVSIISHQLGDEYVWMITSNDLTVPPGTPIKSAAEKLKQPVQEIRGICEEIFDKSIFDDALWGGYSANLPVIKAKSGSFRDRGFKLAQDKLHVYSERFTLASLVPEILGEKLPMIKSCLSPLRNTYVRQDAGSPAQLRDRWQTLSGPGAPDLSIDFSQWSLLMDRLTANEGGDIFRVFPNTT